MAVLQGDHGGFEGAHQGDGEGDGDDGPEDRVDPEGWGEVEFDPEGERDDDGGQDEDDEDGGAVAAVVGAQVQAAGGAGVADGEQAGVELAFAAARAAAGEACLPPGRGWAVIQPR
jgi:hypothetical protein